MRLDWHRAMVLLRAFFAWREVYNTGVHSYQENTVTGERRVRRVVAGGYQPVDHRWLAHVADQGLEPDDGDDE